MNNKIIICGGNGAGKSTLGKALAEKTVTDWLEKTDIPVIEIDGTQPVEKSVEMILRKLKTEP